MIIDVHHHYIPKQFFEQSGGMIPDDTDAAWNDGKVVFKHRKTGHAMTPPMDPTWWYDEDKQLRAMDAAGVDHAILSVACFQDWMTDAAARVINDSVADLVHRRPDRFSGMISIAPDGGDAMVEELDRARGLGLKAVNITTANRGRYPDHPDFQLLFAEAANRNLPIHVHPSWETPLQHMAEWDLERTIGKPTDLNLAIARLIFSGRFTDNPNLRVIAAHMGGSLPVTYRRLFLGDKGYTDIPDFDYAELLKRVFVDTGPGMWWAPVDMECGTKTIGSDQMVFGSDYPLSNDPSNVTKKAVRNVAEAEIAAPERSKIFADNAIRLFDLGHLRGTEDKSATTGPV